MLTDDVGRPFGVFDSCRTDVDASCTDFEGGFECRSIANTTGEFDLEVDRGDELLDDGPVVTATESSVKVDEVEPFRSGFLELQRVFQRLAVVGFGAGFTLVQADGFAVDDVDCGKEHKAVCFSHWFSYMWEASRLSIQLARSFRPARPDFSGWNCTALSGPSSTAAMNFSPCSAYVASPVLGAVCAA